MVTADAAVPVPGAAVTGEPGAPGAAGTLRAAPATPAPATPLPAAIAALPAPQLAAEAQATYQRAIEAQRAGDWAKYGAEIGRLGQILEQLAKTRPQ
jgi:uncharacterized membrane protein (UPF0182 family)